MPVPHPLAYALSDLSWASGLGEAPGAFVDYARYLFVADGEKATRELGFSGPLPEPRRARGLPGLPLSRYRRARPGGPGMKTRAA